MKFGLIVRLVKKTSPLCRNWTIIWTVLNSDGGCFATSEVTSCFEPSHFSSLPKDLYFDQEAAERDMKKEQVAQKKASRPSE